jgi:hypothetical protein
MDETPNSAVIAMSWEKRRIPFKLKPMCNNYKLLPSKANFGRPAHFMISFQRPTIALPTILNWSRHSRGWTGHLFPDHGSQKFPNSQHQGRSIDEVEPHR